MSDKAKSTGPVVPAIRARGAGGGLPQKDPLAWFSRWVAIPAVLVYAAICAVVLLALNLMTSEISRIDGDRGARAISAALDSFVYQLAEQVADEATWTEAYLNTYPGLNAAWLDSTWGTTARAGGHYDAILVTDATGRILFGESVEGTLSGPVADHYRGTDAMLADLGSRSLDIGEDTMVGGYAHTAAGPAAVAAAVIRGSTRQLAATAPDWLFLWLARRIDDTMLERIGERFHVPEPRLAAETDPAHDEEQLALTDATGEVVAWLAWSPQRPGDAAFLHASGIAVVLLLTVGVLIFAVLAGFRASIQKRAEADTRNWRNARYDPVTGLVNRLGLEESVADLTATRPDGALAIAIVEFDGLRQIAGYYGRPTAEALLMQLARLVGTAVGHEVQVARVASDQFALCRIGDDAGLDVARDGETLLEILAEAITVNDLKLKLGATIGIAGGALDQDRAGAIIDRALVALEGARERGGNCIVPYDVTFEADRERRLAMQADIRRGLDAGEFDLAYQPIFDFGRQALVGVEALLRWPRRDGGPLSPGDFIPAAEASGLIEELGIFALRRACEEIAELGDIKLSVNVSTVQFRSPTLTRRIAAILAATRFPAERLQLEITESFLLAHPDRAKEAIEDLRGRGIAIALDDFGTGFSSVGYLRQFSFDRVKLDRSLVADLDHDAVKLALVESTMIYAFAMGLAVTAEGVERREEAAALTRLGCREFQGFLFSGPLPLPALQRLLADAPPMRQAS